MDSALEFSEQSSTFLESVDMHHIVVSLTADIVRERPANIYAYMRAWAMARSPTLGVAGKGQNDYVSLAEERAAIRIQSDWRRYAAGKLVSELQGKLETMRVEEQEAFPEPIPEDRHRPDL